MIFDFQELDNNQRQLITRALQRCSFDFQRLGKELKEEANKAKIEVAFSEINEDGEEPGARAGHAHALKRAGVVLGLAYEDGRIAINEELEADPPLVHEVFLAEAAHLVDFFLLTQADRTQIIRAFDREGAGWWSGPYEEQIGEAFMAAFVEAYSDIEPTTVRTIKAPQRVIDLIRERLDSRVMSNLIRQALHH